MSGRIFDAGLDLTTYAAGSEQDPAYRDLDDPNPHPRPRTAADENRSRTAWGLPTIDDERSDAA